MFQVKVVCRRHNVDLVYKKCEEVFPLLQANSHMNMLKMMFLVVSKV